MSYCVSLERTSGGQTNACPLDCKYEPEVPICGSDGNVYKNECEMQMLNCGSVVGSFEHRLFLMFFRDFVNSNDCDIRSSGKRGER